MSNARLTEFLDKQLGCVQGRIEWRKRRLRATSFDRTTWEAQFQQFLDEVRLWTETSLILSFDDLSASRYPTVSSQTSALAEQIAPFLGATAASLLNGGTLAFDIELKCPATHQLASYRFYGVAFTNRAREPSDPLYDPPQFTPVPSILFSCDALTFAHHARDTCMRERGCEIPLLEREERTAIFLKATESWNAYTERTLHVFGKLCPYTRVEESGLHWRARHKDPVFAEHRKDVHLHEMPVLYCKDIVGQWENVLDEEKRSKGAHVISGGQRGYLPETHRKGDAMLRTELADLIRTAPRLDRAAIDPALLEISERMLETSEEAGKKAIFFEWLARKQPCLFGRAVAHGNQDVDVDMLWLTDADIEKGDAHLEARIQSARRKWKDRAEQGASHGFLVFFNSRELMTVAPSDAFVSICKRAGDLYLPETRPVEVDTIYTEAVPLRMRDGLLYLFKGGINFFYTTAHDTLNHDRRVPGGLLISINSPGQYANSLVQRGLAGSLQEATQHTYNLAVRSVGNGGIGRRSGGSCTWHNRDSTLTAHSTAMDKKLPAYVPQDFDREKFSGNYHTDILVPQFVTAHASETGEEYRWSHVFFDFYSEDVVPYLHPNFGQWHGLPVPDEAKYFNPWKPEKPENRPWQETRFWRSLISRRDAATAC